jgi:arylsulfatase A-like enzyme
MLSDQGWGDFGLFGAGVTNNSYHARASVLPAELHVTTWTVTEAIRVMEDHVRTYGREEPFFLYVSFSKPHPPWDPPPQFFDHYYADADLTMPVVGDAAGYVQSPSPFVAGTHGPIPEGEVYQAKAKDLRRARAGYYGLIDQIDAQITRLAYHLWRSLIIRNTIFSFASDHGEMLGDHHWWAKSVGYQGSIRVPFVLSFPKEMSLPAGVRYPETTVGLADLMPTVLDACNLPIPERCDGASLMPLIRGEVNELNRGHLHGEHLEYCHFLVDHTEKFIWHYRMGVKEYYDLREDPTECHNRYSNEGRPRMLEEQLKELLVDQGRESEFMRGGKLDDALAQTYSHEPPDYAR